MRIAVLGGGTAGFVAAAHFTRHLPQAQLLHVFDSSIPTIGVGEGTTPRFPGWFEEVMSTAWAAMPRTVARPPSFADQREDIVCVRCGNFRPSRATPHEAASPRRRSRRSRKCRPGK